jgi:hypothetical protein
MVNAPFDFAYFNHRAPSLLSFIFDSPLNTFSSATNPTNVFLSRPCLPSFSLSFILQPPLARSDHLASKMEANMRERVSALNVPFALIPPSSPNIHRFFVGAFPSTSNSVSLLILRCVNSSLTKAISIHSFPPAVVVPSPHSTAFAETIPRGSSPPPKAAFPHTNYSSLVLALLHKMGHHCQVVAPSSRKPIPPSTSPFTRLFPHLSIHFNLNRFETFPFVSPHNSHEVSNSRPPFDS